MYKSLEHIGYVETFSHLIECRSSLEKLLLFVVMILMIDLAWGATVATDVRDAQSLSKRAFEIS